MTIAVILTSISAQMARLDVLPKPKQGYAGLSFIDFILADVKFRKSSAIM